MAERVAAEGARVVLAARGKLAGDELATSLPDAIFIATDVTVEADVALLVRQAVERYGRIDGVFNNVGAATALGPLPGIDGDAWNAELALNLSSTCSATRRSSSREPRLPSTAASRRPDKRGAAEHRGTTVVTRGTGAPRGTLTCGGRTAPPVG
ncbi:SDR family oxidoreductase [Dactylosporangium sp. NBC_01737]|uniref:SDR family oxidoreductase n=1 Tax=Dactylosporangium sp. NBC_01737 TaxID=2975959 RepID=UPI002E0EEF38|nr:SDR family oxidoreductase [Dactylosporangium sp. NBC_01737]